MNKTSGTSKSAADKLVKNIRRKPDLRNICSRPKRKRGFEAFSDALSGADICPASLCGLTDAAGPYGVRRSGPIQRRVLEGTLLHTGFPNPVSRPLRHATPCPLSLRRLAVVSVLCRRDRSPVCFTCLHQRPNDPSHPLPGNTCLHV